MPQEKIQVPACMVGVEVKKGGMQSHHHPVKKRTADGGSRICCFCMCGEKADDPSGSVLVRERRRKFITGCTNSLAVCVGLIGYTFLGAVLFVAIEGGGNFTSGKTPHPKSPDKPATHEWPADFGDSLRNRAVENIWEITVNLNILYRENWTRLAALEIARFQEQLAHELAKELEDESTASDNDELGSTQWDLASGLLYSITILTTTGYGKLGPKTVLGKTATMVYAAVGIPLMLVYLSSIGQLLSTCAIALFRRRHQRRDHPPPPAPRLEPFYIRAPGGSEGGTTGGDPRHLHCSDTLHKSPSISINSSHYNAGTPTVVHATGKGTFSTVLCFGVMIAYICCGAVIVCLLEKSWTYLDGVFFCFMTLSTINFVDGGGTARGGPRAGDPTTVWFFSLYILWGMALTAMCFNIFHREVVYRLDAGAYTSCHQRPLPHASSSSSS